VFDLRLYGDPYTIIPRVEFMRQRMKALGCGKPIICTEYGGPNLFEFPENRKYIELVVAWSQSMTSPGGQAQPSAGAGKNSVEELYKSMDTLAPQTQMFMQGCPPELDAKYQRIQARSLVMRNLFALAAGVQKTVYWYLPAHTPSRDERYDIMNLMYGKIGLLEFKDGVTDKRDAAADAFERMARALDGVEAVRRIEIPDRPSIFLFEAARAKRGLAYVVWERRDAFAGEDAAAVPVDLSLPGRTGRVVDALGQVVLEQAVGQSLRLFVSVTPIFIEPI